MSTPAVAGAIALWLEACPTLTTDDIRDILSRTCRHPEPELSYPNNIYGHGEIDVYRGLLDILGLPTVIAELSQHQPSALTIRPADGGIRLSFDKAPAQPFTVRVYTLSGQLLGEQVIRPTASTEYLLPIGHASGISVVQVNSQEQGVTGSALIRR